MKNREVYPLGTRVRIAQDKLSNRVGTVVELRQDEECMKMWVHWDGDFICPDVPRIIGGFRPMELKEVKE
jgi:hypothetical protein